MAKKMDTIIMMNQNDKRMENKIEAGLPSVRVPHFPFSLPLHVILVVKKDSR